MHAWVILKWQNILNTLTYVLVQELPSQLLVSSEVSLYNGVIRNVVEIVYQDRPVGLNDKQHNHLQDYVVGDFPHLKLPSNIAPWDKLHKTVSRQNIHDVNKMFQLILTQTNSMYLS